MPLPQCIRPEDHGFNPFENENAYRGIVYINKKGQKWVSNLEGLLMSTGKNEATLADDGYAINTYHKIEDSLNLFAVSAA